MRVLMVTDFPLRSGAVLGGVQGYAYNLARALNGMPEVELEVVVPPFGRAGLQGGQVLTVDGIRVHTVPEDAGGKGRIRLLFEAPRVIARFVADHPSDIVHVQDSSLIAKAVGQPSVFTVHGIPERDARFFYYSGRLPKPLYLGMLAATHGRARRSARNVVAINPYVHQFLAPKGRQRVWDIENAVADSWFDVERTPVPGRIFAPSLVIRRKNPAGLIRAVAEVAKGHPDVELRLAGSLDLDEPYVQECRALACSLGVGDRVRFLGNLSVPDVQEELSRAHCLALASFNETSPLVISEAMAAGVPVVASRLCGMPWMVVEGVTGRLVDPYDVSDIARGLSLVLSTDDVAAMGREARVQADARYRARNVAARTFDAYRQVLAAGAGCSSGSTGA